MKRIIYITVLLLSGFSVFGQQSATFTHYRYNPTAQNPAFAGSRGVLSTTLIHRSQWVGADGSPNTQSLVVNTPLWKELLGVGISLENDVVGPTRGTSVNLDFAYRMKLDENQKLVFGIKGGLTNYNRILQGLTAAESNDMSIDGAVERSNLFNFGVGVLYMNKKFYAGIAAPKLLENDFENPSGVSNSLVAGERRHYFVTAGTAIELKETLDFKPSTLIKITAGAPIQADLTGVLAFNEKFEIGAMWRSSDALGVLVGYVWNNNFRIGYSFDWSYGYRTFNYNFGSHEVMLRYDLRYNGGKDILSPRYF